MRMLLATLLLLFGVPQGAPTTQTGAIEGKVVRASNSEPISGVQISLVVPSPQSSSTTTPAAPVPPPPTQMQLSQTPQGIQVTMTVGGATTTQVIPADTFATLQRGGQLTPDMIATFLRTGAVPNTLTAGTDGDGRFAFQNLAPGVYTLRAQRQGYFGPMSPQGQYAAIVTQSITVVANKTAR